MYSITFFCMFIFLSASGCDHFSIRNDSVNTRLKNPDVYMRFQKYGWNKMGNDACLDYSQRYKDAVCVWKEFEHNCDSLFSNHTCKENVQVLVYDKISSGTLNRYNVSVLGGTRQDKELVERAEKEVRKILKD
ncbi:MAG: hypothetical protein AB7F86_13750 [Bdellovibrionales bacterium]